MRIFSYVSLGLCGAVALAWVMAWIAAMMRDQFGRAILMALAMMVLVCCGITGAVWLLMN